MLLFLITTENVNICGVNQDDECAFNSSKIAASITNYGEIKNGSEVSLQEAVAFYGPVSVCIDSSSFQWNYYTEG